MNETHAQPAVVVGIDGSTMALHAALWAIDEAVRRDIPLRLVHIVESGGAPTEDTAPQLATARRSLNRVVRAVEATHKAVKIETDIVHGQPAASLIRISRDAAIVCVGAVGSHHFQHGRIGSTASAVAGRAHCAVAIVHAGTRPDRPHANVILAAADDLRHVESVLKTAAYEATMRDATLRVITCWQPPRSDPLALEKGDIEISAQLERHLEHWRSRHRDLRAEAVAVHGSLSGYLTTHAAELQSVIVTARCPGQVNEVVGAAGYGALAGSDCVVLVVDHHHL
ncbi:universal stress protein [Mycobacterium paraterrae]|uniref:Universal stress protein n=1 Tax=Mycobacterium paraterrae TaxID=577492 RepID=A0ABY3VWV9_9MYCO|nr:universal stress protein [Mycobacterium paraterrae]UMB72052.1 universal stress protein [Mycobacterium paraterrae]